MTVEALIRSVSVDSLLAARAAALEGFRRTQVALRETNRATEGLDLVVPAFYDQRYTHIHEDRAAEMFRLDVDRRIWRKLLQDSGLADLMDHKTKQEWQSSLEKGAFPEVTAANVRATFMSLYDKRGQMFNDGVVNVFKSLSWDYKSNSPRFLNKKIILKSAIGYSYGLHHYSADKLDDLLRVMMVLDGKPEPDYPNRTTVIASNARFNGQSEDLIVHDMMKLRAFNNGNVHVYFQRPDLVEKMNKIIAAAFPNALPPADI
jgi:hypothetical protein